MQGDLTMMELHRELSFLRALYQTIPDLVWLKDVDGTYLACNPAFAAYRGASAAEIIGKRDADLPSAEDAQLRRQIEQQTIADRQSHSREQWLTYPDGRRRRVETTVTAVHGADGNIFGVLGISRDITAPRGRHPADQQLASIVEYAHDFIGIADLEGNIQFVNQAGRALVGLGPTEEARGRRIPDFVHEESRALMVEEILPTVMATGHWSGELQFRDFRTDEAIPVLSECFRIDDTTGKPINVATVSRDIIERKRNERVQGRHNRVLHTIASLNEMMIGEVDEQQLMAKICDALVRDNLFRLAWIGQVEPDGVHVRVVAGAGHEHDYLHGADIRCDQSPQGRGPTGQAISLGRTVINEDTATNEQFAPWRELALSKGYRSSAATPVRVQGAVIGAVNLYSEEPHAFGPDEVVLLEKLAGDLGVALERRAAEAALRESEAKFRLLLDSTAEAIYGVDLAGICTFANSSCLRLLGYEREEDLIGKNIHAIIHHTYPDGRPYPKEQCHVRLATLQGEATNVDSEVHFRPDGTSFPVEYWSHPMYRGSELVGAVVAFVDVTERKRAEQALRDSEERYRQISSVTTDVLFSCVRAHESRFRIEWATGSVERVFGYSVEETLESGCWRCLVHPDDLPLFDAHITSLAPGQSSECELRIIHKDGSVRFLHTYSKVVVETGPHSHVHRLYGACQDITERKAAESALAESEQRYRALFDASGDCILVLRGDQIVDCNSVATRILAPTREKIIGQSIIRFSPDSQPDGRLSAMKAREIIDAALRRETRIFEWRLMGYDGTSFDAEVSLTNVELGGKAHLIAGLRDISERKQTKEHIEFLAHHDALTGLPNRTLLRDRFEQALAFAERGKSHVAMLFLDLDNFKLVNDTLGHAAGDHLLQAVVSRLSECVRDTDTVSRQGGDEFIVLLNDILYPGTVERIAGEVLARLGESVEIDGHLLSMPCSIGISLYPEDGRDFDSLLQKADTAMYNAKDAGRNTYRFFDEEMNRWAQERLLLQNRLHQALGNGELSLHFQPQLEIGSDRVLGVEALLRWRSPELGDVPPGRFIPVAEDCGVIVPIGAWVLEEACRQAQEWRSAGLGDLSISVNLSALQFRRDGLLEAVTSALSKSGLPPHLLELELTESTLLKHLDKTLESAQRIKTLGVRLAIDDFGTGYFSLSYLKRFAVHKLKIDQTFVRDLGSDPDHAAIVRAIIELARGLHLEISAEGVETEGQLDFLRQAGCQEVQGHLFSRPLAAAELEDFLRSRTNR